MEILRFEDYSFFYPDCEKSAIRNVSFTVNQGEFITLCGKSGSGKTTLLKSIKPEIAPHGNRDGKMYISGEEIMDIKSVSGNKIGFVMQNPDNQIVTDTVWHELAFGLENIGIQAEEMRIRVAEIAAFFGIEKWFHKSTAELSGGQKQILNLASVMVMEPELLLLDEPTSQLDPISAGEFFSALVRINRELGTAIILSEHRLDEIFPRTKRVIVMEDGEIIADGTADYAAKTLIESGNDMSLSLPASARIFSQFSGYPVSVPDAREILDGILQDKGMCGVFVPENKRSLSDDVAVSVKNIHYRYEKNMPYVLSGLSLKVKKGEIYGILGGNGSGKSTLLWLISGALKLQAGKVKSQGSVALLPQNPQCMFLKNTVYAELLEVSDEQRALEIMEKYNLLSLKDRHPYDLSGGEQQKLALGKILLTNPDILLLDEPTKGFDGFFKKELCMALKSLSGNGVTVVMVSHDLEFCAECCDRCGLLFDGGIISQGTPREFFGGKKFYTVQTARIFKGFADNVVTVGDGIELLKVLEGTK